MGRSKRKGNRSHHQHNLRPAVAAQTGAELRKEEVRKVVESTNSESNVADNSTIRKNAIAFTNEVTVSCNIVPHQRSRYVYLVFLLLHYKAPGEFFSPVELDDIEIFRRIGSVHQVLAAIDYLGDQRNSSTGDLETRSDPYGWRIRPRVVHESLVAPKVYEEVEDEIDDDEVADDEVAGEPRPKVTEERLRNVQEVYYSNEYKAKDFIRRTDGGRTMCDRCYKHVISGHRRRDRLGKWVHFCDTCWEARVAGKGWDDR